MRIIRTQVLLPILFWGLALFVQAQLSTPRQSKDEVLRGFLNFLFKSHNLPEASEGQSLWGEYGDIDRSEAERLSKFVWDVFRDSRRKLPDLLKDLKNKRITFDPDVLRYELKRQGQKGANGWALTLSLHGGGVEAKRVNDQQWRAQQKRYEAPGIYLCPRAPRDTWNQWQDDHIYPMVDMLLQQMILLEDVDPNRIYLTGYSSGGYGALTLGAKMPDRFAAVSAVAAGPPEGQAPAENWRNTPLRFQVGEQDIAYGRVGFCRDYDKQFQVLKKSDSEGFPCEFIEHPGKGHEIIDVGTVDWLQRHQRRTRPRLISWKLSDHFVRRFFWLGVDQPEPGQSILASITDNQISLEASAGIRRVRLRLDDALVDLDRSVSVTANGTVIFQGKVRRNLKCLVETVQERGDPALTFPAELEVVIPRLVAATTENVPTARKISFPADKESP